MQLTVWVELMVTPNNGSTLFLIATSVKSSRSSNDELETNVFETVCHRRQVDERDN